MIEEGGTHRAFVHEHAARFCECDEFREVLRRRGLFVAAPDPFQVGPRIHVRAEFEIGIGLSECIFELIKVLCRVLHLLLILEWQRNAEWRVHTLWAENANVEADALVPGTLHELDRLIGNLVHKLRKPVVQVLFDMRRFWHIERPRAEVVLAHCVHACLPDAVDLVRGHQP